MTTREGVWGGETVGKSMTVQLRLDTAGVAYLPLPSSAQIPASHSPALLFWLHALCHQGLFFEFTHGYIPC
jgi:hypothetical protein